MKVRSLYSARGLRDRLAIIAAAAIALVFIATFARSLIGALDARAAVDRLRKENAALQEQVDALAAERLLLGDRAFLELLARGYGLGSPLEHPFALTADAPDLPIDAPGSAARRLATPRVYESPLERWLEILFGG
jgi:cell division protein FtsB